LIHRAKKPAIMATTAATPPFAPTEYPAAVEAVADAPAVVAEAGGLVDEPVGVVAVPLEAPGVRAPEEERVVVPVARAPEEERVVVPEADPVAELVAEPVAEGVVNGTDCGVALGPVGERLAAPHSALCNARAA
jgi:hypothetical protein